MLRPKSGARHNGTLYEYAESSGKSRNSCYKCIHCDDGFCSRRKAQIVEIFSNYYQYCEFYKTECEHEEIVESDKAFDLDSYRKRKAAGKELHEVEISSRTKKSVTQNEEVKNVVLKTITLTRKLDDTKITVKIVNRLSFAISNKSIIEVTTASTFGKRMKNVNIGSLVELEGFRCIVSDIEYSKDKAGLNVMPEVGRIIQTDTSRPERQKRNNRGHDKTVISSSRRKSKVISINSKVILRRLVDDSRLTVQFSEKPNYGPTSSVGDILVGIRSPLGKDLLGAKNGKLILHNGYRYIVEEIK